MSESNNPQSRVEELIENILGAGYQVEPQSRVEKILHAIATNGTYTDPPQSRVEKLLIDVLNSGGGGITVEALNVTENGTTTAPTGKAYSPVTVDVEPDLTTKSITANGTYQAASDNVDGYSEVTVNVSGGGGESVPEKDVNFIDYDGTVLYSYTAQEALALTALPANPSHTGLTAQGWNYTLAEVKTEVNSVGGATVGQMYVTDDGKTRIYIHLYNGRLAPYLTLRVNGTVTIDWGDGSQADTLTGSSVYTDVSVQHIYADEGAYIITIDATSATVYIQGSSYGQKLLRSATGKNAANKDKPYANAIKKVEIGANTTITGYAFCLCTSMESIMLPVNAIDSSADYQFYNCYSLHGIIVNRLTNSMFLGCNALTRVSIATSLQLKDSLFKNCYSLAQFVIPSFATSIPASCFDGAAGLSSLAIPNGVTSIGAQGLGTNGLGEVHLKPTTPPTAGSSIFQYVPTDIVIYVPYSADHSILNAYKTATNWSTYASYMQEEPA